MSALPQPTTDRALAKGDLNRHGYCIAADDVVADASPELLALLGFRVWDGYGKLDDPGVEFIARPGAKKNDLRKGNEMNVFDLSVTDALLSTTRSVRKRLDLERAVPEGIIRECLELALQAPTGSNRQGWRWIVVTDADKRHALAELYRKGAGSYLDDGYEEAKAAGAAQDVRVYDSARYLYDRLEEVPVHIIPCIQMRAELVGKPEILWPSMMGSILPAVWSFQLALRARGLGSTFTTLHLNCSDEGAALLGIPDNVKQAGLLPVAYTLGTDFKPAKRRPLDDVLHWNGWSA